MHWILFALIAALTAGACGPTARGGPGPAERSESQPALRRTLLVVNRVEPADLAAKAFRAAAITLGATKRFFNAGLVILDDQSVSHRYLADRVPELNTESWKVAPDGTMETTYHLRPGLTWHDGTPLTSEDFAFAWRVYTTPALGVATLRPQGFIEAVSTPDPQTIRLHWKAPYPRAAELDYGSLPPLPRHLLETPFQTDAPDEFLAQPYWSTQYVAAGPFRLTRWEPGAFIEGAAFDGHAGGRPRIDAIRITWINDSNTAVSTMLSGGVHLLIDDAVYIDQAATIRRELVARGAAKIVVQPGLWRGTQVQLHPDRVAPASRALADLRVRKALAYAVDRQTLIDTIYEGVALRADTFVPPTVSYYAELDRAVTKYEFDPRRAQQLMEQAGYPKASNGIFTSPADGQFSAELVAIQNPQNEAERTVMASIWRSVGFDIAETTMPVAQSQDGEARAKFTGLFTTGLASGEDQYANYAITPTAANRWSGGNRGSWSNAEYERLATLYQTTLDRTLQIQQMAQMAKIVSDELPAIPLVFSPRVTPHVIGLRGPDAEASAANFWRVHEWELD